MKNYVNPDIVKGKLYHYYLTKDNTVAFFNYNGKEVVTKNYLIASNRGYTAQFNKKHISSYEKVDSGLKFLAEVSHKDVIETEGAEFFSFKGREGNNKYFISFVYSEKSVIFNYYNRYMSTPLFIKLPLEESGTLMCMVIDLLECHDKKLAEKIKTEIFNFRKEEKEEAKADVPQDNTR